MRIMIVCVALAAAACANQPPPPTAAAAPPPPYAAAAAAVADNSVAAPGVSVAPDAPTRPPQPGDVVVPSARERPVPGAPRDTRSVTERMADIRAWDNCVLHAQSEGENDPTRPSLTDPEEMCSRHLGMVSRTAVPYSRQH